MTNKTRGSHTFEVKTDSMNRDFLVDWLTAIIPEDWTKNHKKNFVCIGALIIITGKCNIDKLPTNHHEYRRSMQSLVKWGLNGLQKRRM